MGMLSEVCLSKIGTCGDRAASQKGQAIGEEVNQKDKA